MIIYKVYRISRDGKDKYPVGEAYTFEKATYLYEDACKYGLRGQSILLEKHIVTTEVLNKFQFTEETLNS